MKAYVETIRCKACGSHDTVKDGRIKNGQRWKCKACGRKFLDNQARYGMKTPFVQVQKAIQLYYQGMSLNTICQYLQNEYNNYVSISTVYEWVVKYSHEALVATRKYHPIVGDMWVASEINLDVLGEQVWVWDIIDTKTHFLLASKVSLKHDVWDFYYIIEEAIGKAIKNPRIVIANNIPSCIEILRYPLMVKYSSREVEHFREILQWRSGLVSDSKSLKKLDKVFDFIDGWLVYYNYFGHQEALGGRTPSELAGVKHIYKDNPRSRAF